MNNSLHMRQHNSLLKEESKKETPNLEDAKRMISELVIFDGKLVMGSEEKDSDRMQSTDSEGRPAEV